jgi:hypothetical protein
VVARRPAAASDSASDSKKIHTLGSARGMIEYALKSPVTCRSPVGPDHPEILCCMGISLRDSASIPAANPMKVDMAVTAMIVSQVKRGSGWYVRQKSEFGPFKASHC